MYPLLYNIHKNKDKDQKYCQEVFHIKIQISNLKLSRVLPEEEKLEFVKTSVSWIEGRNTMDACFILNYGYEAPLFWPQVTICLYKGSTY